MRKAFLTCCLAWWFAVLQGLSLQAFAAYNPALIDTSNTSSSQPPAVMSTPPPADGASSEPRPQIEGLRPILITVPSLAGLSLDDARATLLDTNLRVGQVTRAESSDEPDTVIRQSPEARARVRPGTAVSLVIAEPAMVTVPPLTGLPLNQARSILSELDLQFGQLTSAESDGEPGTIIEQSPKARTRVKPGTPVALVLSIRSLVEVPHVVGLELGDARKVIERAGLIPITDTMNSRNDEAVVTSQNPEPPTTVRKGSSVVLTLRTIAAPPIIKKPSRPTKTPPWPAIFGGAALMTIIGGALLFMRSSRVKAAPRNKEVHVSIREKLDEGTQQVQTTGNPEKAPTIVVTIRPDNGVQEIHPS
ncbi:PASTA domain containing protein [Chlorobaculum parvum NCIB 8327]|uniref:PASTA domain containing protein n=1 Tax=Chlorobaculum parvum (strain DSM 263 / NCIMB 8327) TaxID=517417 RepID=B3QR53_CHLP8|nr:PASTA domain-containing protein [Chlorobaculum parvum]ACF10597.1 PASTA domain containing protein [Chlorobaculum parvum NCIB 8327]